MVFLNIFLTDSVREVTFDEGESKAKELGGIFMETSAMSGSNVKQLFKKIALSLPGTDVKDESGNAPCKS